MSQIFVWQRILGVARQTSDFCTPIPFSISPIHRTRGEVTSTTIIRYPGVVATI